MERINAPWHAMQTARQIAPDERVLWADRPRRGFRIEIPPPQQVVAGLVPIAIALIWQVTILSTPAFNGSFSDVSARISSPDATAPAPASDFPDDELRLGFRLLQAILLTSGAILIARPSVAGFLNRRRAVYGLTEHRVLIVDGVLGRRITSLPLASLGEISIRERRDGSGTITFDRAQSLLSPALGGPWATAAQPARFEWIDDARAVYARILAAQQALRVAPLN